MSNALGVGIYIKNNLSYTIRDELCTTQPEFESIWVEFEHNIFCGLIYRHPESKQDKTAECLYKATEKINHEGKVCLLMGGLNFNLLNCDSHPGTEDFVHTLGSHAFHSEILNLPE